VETSYFNIESLKKRGSLGLGLPNGRYFTGLAGILLLI